MIIEFRRRTLLPLDDVLGCLRDSIPKLTRSSLHRCLERHGISRLHAVVAGETTTVALHHVDVVYAPFGGEAEGLVTALVGEGLAHRDRLRVGLGALDLAVQEILEADTRPVRRNRLHFIKRKEVVSRVIEAFASGTGR